MRVTVNGEAREVSAVTIAGLLSELEYDGTHYAVAVNYDVLPKARWAEAAIEAGDAIEIISPRQGG